MIHSFTIANLVECFAYFDVELKGLRLSEEILSLKIYGTQNDIRLAIKGLYALINQQLKKLSDIETKAAKSLPKDLKAYLKNIENDGDYKKHYDPLAGEYLRYCELNEIQPHPEVMDGFI